MVHLNIQVNSSTNDAANKPIKAGDVYDEDDDFYYIGSMSFLVVVIMSGYVFDNVTIPAGSTIDYAEFRPAITTGSPPALVDSDIKVWGVDEDNASTWAETTNEPKDATTTTAFSEYHITENIGTINDIHIDATDIIQEIVDRENWASGNSMGFLIEPISTGIGGINVRCWNWERGIGHSDGARIDIHYTPPGGGDAAITKINIDDTWKTVNATKINIGDNWKVATGKINIGDTWKEVS